MNNCGIPIRSMLLSLLFIIQIVFSDCLKAQIEIISVSVLEGNDVDIEYRAQNITDVDVRFFPQISTRKPSPTPIIKPIFNLEGTISISSSELPKDLVAGSAFQLMQSGHRSNVHAILFLKDVSTTIIGCDMNLDIIWQNYSVFDTDINNPLPVSFTHIDIYAFKRPDGPNPGNLLASLPQGVGVQNLTEIIEAGDYYIQLRSYDDQNEAWSNIVDVNVGSVEFPQHIEIERVDVVDDAFIQIYASTNDTSISDFKYLLYRSDDKGEPFRIIDEQVGGPSSMIFEDDGINLRENEWYYKVEAKRIGCDEAANKKMSDPVSSLFLNADYDESFDPSVDQDVRIGLEWVHDPKWTNYELFWLPVDQPPQLIDSYTSNINNADHRISINDLTETIFYRMVAYDGSGSLINSNIASVRIEPILFPQKGSGQSHALRPSSTVTEDGVTYPNRFFKPLFVIPYDAYNMSIYDRNGLLVFTTGDHQVAWDGTINGPGGQDAPAGAYIYHITITDLNDDRHEKKGVVYLVR